MDIIADRILIEDPAVNIIRVKSNADLLSSIRSQTIAEKENHIFLYCILNAAELDDILEMFPDAHIYRAQELCHQVPVCVRESKIRSDKF